MYRANANLLIGSLVARLLPEYKSRLLKSWADQSRFTRVDRLLFSPVMAAWAKFEYLAIPDPDERERAKDGLMGGQNAASWAEHYQRQPMDFTRPLGRMSYGEACPLMPGLDSLLEQRRDPTLVIQIGSSSGREIAWLAQRHPHHRYVGIDPYPDVIEVSRRYHALPNLTFVAASARAIPGLIADRIEPVLLFSSGSLQYAQPEHVAKLFEELAKRRRLELWLLEPAQESGRDPSSVPGSTWQGNFSYTHNYRCYAEAAGWQTKICEIIRPYSHDRMRRSTVHYFYAGSTHE